MSEPLDRRGFLFSGAAATAMAAAAPAPASAAAAETVFLSTWEWGIEANAKAAAVVASGGSLIDAVEKGINVAEDDPNVDTVGYGVWFWSFEMAGTRSLMFGRATPRLYTTRRFESF